MNKTIAHNVKKIKKPVRGVLLSHYIYKIYFIYYIFSSLWRLSSPLFYGTDTGTTRVFVVPSFGGCYPSPAFPDTPGFVVNSDPVRKLLIFAIMPALRGQVDKTRAREGRAYVIRTDMPEGTQNARARVREERPFCWWRVNSANHRNQTESKSYSGLQICSLSVPEKKALKSLSSRFDG